MKKILVTGGLGFIGSKIIPLLEEKGLEVDIYDIKNGDDIFDSKRLSKRMKSAMAVIHMVAIPHFIPSKTWPDYEHLNVKGTSAVLSAAHDVEIERFIFFSSGAVYGFDGGFVPPGSYPIPISHLGDINQVNLYARSKIFAEREVKKAGISTRIVLRVNWPGGCPNESMIVQHCYAVVSWENLNEIVYQSVVNKKLNGFHVFNAINAKTTKGEDALLEVNNRLDMLGV